MQIIGSENNAMQYCSIARACTRARAHTARARTRTRTLGKLFIECYLRNTDENIALSNLLL